MKPFFTFLSALFIAWNVAGQGIHNSIESACRESDSLKRYQLMKECMEKTQESFPDSLLYFSQTINQLIPKPDILAKALNSYSLAEYYHALDKHSESLKHRMDAVFAYETAKPADLEYLAKSYIGAGVSNELLYRYDNAHIFYNKAFVLAVNLHDRKMMAEIHSDRCFVYYGQGDFINASKQLELALKIAFEINDSSGIAKEYNNLGYIYVEWGKYDMGIEHYKKSLEYSLLTNTLPRVSVCYNNIGMAYFSKGDYVQAEDYIKRALEIDEANNWQLNAARRYNNLGLIAFRQNKTEEAVAYLNKASEVFYKQNDMVSYAKALVNISDIYMAEQKYALASPFLKKGYDVALQTGNLPLIQFNTKKMYLYYKAVGDFKHALDFLELHNELSDSLYSLESARVVEEMATIYETEKKETEIQRLNTESQLKEDVIERKNQQQILLAALAILLLLILIATVLITIKIRHQRMQLQKLNTVKNRLFALISHDLRGYSAVFQEAGMLIRYHLKKQNFEKIEGFSEQLELNAISFNSQLDNVLNWALNQLSGYKLNPEVIFPAAECNTLIAHIAESLLLKGNVIKNEIPEDWSIRMDKGAFAVIMRNLLSNANKFTENGSIVLSQEISVSNFRIIVADTGIGMDEETLGTLFTNESVKSARGTKGEKGSGIGLKLVKTFVELSGGIMQVYSQPGKGSRFVLDFKV